MCTANDAGTGTGERCRPVPFRCRRPTIRTAAGLLAAVALAVQPARAQPAPADTVHPGVAAPAPATPAQAKKPEPFSTEVSFAQFVQGVVSGGVEQGEGEYGGKLDVQLKVSTQGLGLWPGGVLEARAATRYGETATVHAGAALPINTALVDPASSGTATSLVTLTYTQLLPLGRTPGNALAVGFGRFSTLELVPDGTGVTGYMNVGQIAPTHEARNVPLVTLGASMALLMGGEPVLTLLVVDSKNSSMTSGLSDLFVDGVTIFPALTLPTRFFGRPGHQGIHGTWSSQELTPFDEIPHLLLPRPDTTVALDRQSGGWSLTYQGDQYIQASAGPPRTGWRLYWVAGVADEATNPVGRYFNVGIAGNLRGRPLDRFGAGWAYTGWGDDFQALLGRPVQIEDEQSLELFYNVALAPWIRFTADLQVVWPFLPGAETAVIPGARLQLVF